MIRILTICCPIMSTRTTRTDLELKDTPALSILEERARDFPHVDVRGVAACQDLLRVAKRVLGSFVDDFARHGISPGRYSILMELLSARNRLAPSEIAERIGVSRATVTGLVDGLEWDGLVARRPLKAGDRRRTSVRLSPKGRRLLERLMPVLFSRMASLVQPLSARERTTLRVLLRRVEGGLVETGGGRDE